MASRPPHPVPLTVRSTRVKAARRLARRTARAESGLFLVEGPKSVAEALRTVGRVVEVFAAVELDRSHPELRAAALDSGVAWHPVEDAAISALGQTVTPQGCVAVCRCVDVPLSTVLGTALGTGLDTEPGTQLSLVALCSDVGDPGNAGTIIRCADAAGADAVVLTGDSVDAHNPKTVRASAGSLFHVRLAVARGSAGTASAVSACRARGLTVLAADGHGELDLDRALDTGVLVGPTAWLFGSEAHGLDRDHAGLADHRVRVPVHGRAESLNLAAAAAVCLYASARAQRA